MDIECVSTSFAVKFTVITEEILNYSLFPIIGASLFGLLIIALPETEYAEAKTKIIS